LKLAIYSTITFGLLIFVQLVKPQLSTPSGNASADTIKNEPIVEQVIKGVHSIGSKDEQKEWELWADEAIDYQEVEKWDLRIVKVAFFAESEQTFRVTGDTGAVDMATKDLLISGNVISENTDGYVFSTNQLRYNSEKRELRSPDEVEFLSQKDVDGFRFLLKGKGLFASVVNSTLEIASNVSGKRTSSRGETTDIKSNKMKLDNEKRQLLFEEDVEINHKGMILRGPVAAFVYSKQEKKVTLIRLFGGVTLNDKLRSATAKVIELNLKTGTIRLAGKPRVLQNNDVLLGEEIILSKGGQRVEVRNVRAKVEETSGADK
jgi:LPS export ABC transporter protein LptC/lipopolysaccharide transport protein LptA